MVNADTFHATIECLQTLFATHRILKVLVSDNIAQFRIVEFSQLMMKNGICYAKMAPYHPLFNELAESSKNL